MKTNFEKLKIPTCIECGKRLHRKDSNICDSCLEDALKDTEIEEGE